MYPVKSFFYSIFNKDFTSKVNDLTKGISVHMEKNHCIFPNDLDDFDIEQMGGEKLNKIEFSFDWGEEVFVDIPTFREFLNMACESYWQEHPESKMILEEYLARPQPALE